MWEKHIKEWIAWWFANHSDTSPSPNQFNITQNIAIRGGWKPFKYQPHMKKQLHEWLTDWYTLSVKKLPKPLT